METTEPRFHVLLQGRRVGPYDRRTIVGMRIKGALASADALLAPDGAELTVADLIGRRPSRRFEPDRTSAPSLVLATYVAGLLGVEGRGFAVPAFRGEMEVRVQSDVLRIAGRFRRGLGWRDDRVKLPLAAIVHAGERGSEVVLGLRQDEGQPLQRVRLELFTPEAAGELVKWLSRATPWPAGSLPPAKAPGSSTMLVWAPVAGVSAVVLVVLAVLLARRL